MTALECERPTAHHLNLDIQVLRAAAILMVLVEHTQINLFYWYTSLEFVEARYWSGAPGVDLFFVISGFVIARSLLPRLLTVSDNATYLAKTLTFLLHRFWRLQPAAWLWLAVPLILSEVFNRSDAFLTFNDNGPGAFAGFLALTNLRDTFLPFGSPSRFSNPYWSLSLEEQFYWLLPVAVFLLRVRIQIPLLLCFSAQFAFPTAFLVHYSQLRPGALAVGVLLAIWETRVAYGVAEPRFLARGRVVRFAFLAGGIALLGVTLGGVAAPPKTMPFAVQSVLAGALVYAASFDRGYIMQPGLLRRVMVWVGARSYGMYLTHMTAFSFVHEVAFRTTVPVWVHSYASAAVHLVCGWGLTMVLAELTFRFVETPCRRYGRSLRIIPADAPGQQLNDAPTSPRTIP